MIEKMTLKLGSLGADFQLITPNSMTKIIGGRVLPIQPVATNTCGGIMPS